MKLLEAPFTLKSALAPGQETDLDTLAQALAASVRGEDSSAAASSAQEDKPRGFVCKICGFIYEGDVLPADFVCPICRRPASDFAPLT